MRRISTPTPLVAPDFRGVRCDHAAVLILQIVVVWLAASALVTFVACAACRSGHREDEQLGYDS